MQHDELQLLIDHWIDVLYELSYATLLVKPSPLTWSYGQLYQHLVDDTGFYLDQAEACLSPAGTTEGSPSTFALSVFEKNAFPDPQIKGDPLNDNIAQPTSKEALLHGLTTLKFRAHELGMRVVQQGGSGKTKHPGLGYFTAAQWMQFAAIHFRHHLAQKKRVDRFVQDAK